MEGGFDAALAHCNLPPSNKMRKELVALLVGQDQERDCLRASDSAKPMREVPRKMNAIASSQLERLRSKDDFDGPCDNEEHLLSLMPPLDLVRIRSRIEQERLERTN